MDNTVFVIVLLHYSKTALVVNILHYM